MSMQLFDGDDVSVSVINAAATAAAGLFLLPSYAHTMGALVRPGGELGAGSVAASNTQMITQVIWPLCMIVVNMRSMQLLRPSTQVVPADRIHRAVALGLQRSGFYDTIEPTAHVSGAGVFDGQLSALFARWQVASSVVNLILIFCVAMVPQRYHCTTLEHPADSPMAESVEVTMAGSCTGFGNHFVTCHHKWVAY